MNGHHGAEPDPRAGDRRIDDHGRPETGLDGLDAALEERLLLTGGVVLRVLLEVAVLLGGPDPGDDLGPPDVGQLGELGPQPGLALGGQPGRLAARRRDAPLGGRARFGSRGARLGRGCSGRGPSAVRLRSRRRPTLSFEGDP